MKTVILCLVLALVPVAATFAAPHQNSPSPTIGIRTETGMQMYRYGRELYRKKDYRGAVPIFEQILKIDCKNEPAQYHLQKIAAKGAEFKDVADFLKNLPCHVSEFSDEDFLSASLYYEKDPDLSLEHVGLYTKGYRKTQSELASQISQYQKMIRQLKEKTKILASSLEATQKTAADAALLRGQLKEARALSEQLSREATQLRTQLAAVKTAYTKESKNLETQIAASATSTKRRTTQESLHQKQLEITEKSQELTALQQKFAALQTRLHQIEASLVKKNTRAKKINNALSTLYDKKDTKQLTKQERKTKQNKKMTP